jgi:hypothetical protein
MGSTKGNVKIRRKVRRPQLIEKSGSPALDDFRNWVGLGLEAREKK